MRRTGRGQESALTQRSPHRSQKVGRGADRGQVLLGVSLLGQLSNPDGR
jgi:hypothetical protein